MRDYTLLDAVIEDFYTGLKYKEIIEKHKLDVTVGDVNNAVRFLRKLGLIDVKRKKESVIKMQQRSSPMKKHFLYNDDEVFNDFMVAIKSIPRDRAIELLAEKYMTTIESVYGAIKRNLFKKRMIKETKND
jgi:hypothetical protein